MQVGNSSTNNNKFQLSNPNHSYSLQVRNPVKQGGSVFGGGGWLVSVLYSFSDIVNTYLLRATSVRCDGAVRLVGR